MSEDAEMENTYGAFFEEEDEEKESEGQDCLAWEWVVSLPSVWMEEKIVWTHKYGDYDSNSITPWPANHAQQCH